MERKRPGCGGKCAVNYSVKEMFLTLQGEGAQSGKVAVFLRFAGCNLWNGRERDRASAVCNFCDTDFIGVNGVNGGQFTDPDALAEAAIKLWPGGGAPLLVCTGGEPILQLDDPLIDALHRVGFFIAVETNGTLIVPGGVDWICVSPKADAPIRQTHGDELKLVFPQEKNHPADFEHFDFERFSLQPLDGPDIEKNTRASIAWCQAHPKWQLSLQTHKWTNIP